MHRHLKSMWQIKILIFASLLLAPAPSFAQVQPTYSSYGWQIDSFDSVIVVNEDASMDVTETIDTEFNPSYFKHGIFRDIPVAYVDRLGNRVTVKLTVTDVLQNGEPATYVISKEGQDTRIRIGESDVVVGGPIQYSISYHVERAMLYFDDYDEVYWNATGTEWEVPIAKSTAVVELPDGVEPLHVSCYTGYFGSSEQDCGTAVDGHIAGFAAEDFLTVSVGFPKGEVYEPSSLVRITWLLQDNWYAIFPILIIVLLGAIWYFFGKDPRMATVVAEFEPPDGLKAAFAGFLAKNSVTSRLTSAMIIQLAVDGYLTIKVDEEKALLGKKRAITLQKKKSGGDLDRVHQLLFGAIFKSKDEMTLTEIRSSKLAGAEIRRIPQEIQLYAKNQNWYTTHSFRMRTFIILAFTCPLFYGGFVGGSIFGGLTAGLLFVAAIVSIFVAAYMPKYTTTGNELARRVLGFKLFMYTAERYRSKWHEEQKMFTEYLPYAIAFNHVKQWANTFRDLAYHQPDWYVSNVAYFTPIDFANNLTSVTTSIGATVSPHSSSGGSSGGGFSGGGFGGGGGGSW